MSSQLQIFSICSIGFLDILEVIPAAPIIYGKLVYPITFKILRIQTEDIEVKDRSDSELQIEPIYSIGSLSTLEII